MSPYGTLLLLGLPHRRGLGHGRVSITEKERQTEAVSQDIKHQCCCTLSVRAVTWLPRSEGRESRQPLDRIQQGSGSACVTGILLWPFGKAQSVLLAQECARQTFGPKKTQSQSNRVDSPVEPTGAEDRTWLSCFNSQRFIPASGSRAGSRITSREWVWLMSYSPHQPPQVILVETRNLQLLLICVCLVAQSCPTLCNPMGVARQAPLSMGILQARTLEWVAMPSSRDIYYIM